jgi:hypothetical protein
MVVVGGVVGIDVGIAVAIGLVAEVMGAIAVGALVGV